MTCTIEELYADMGSRVQLSEVKKKGQNAYIVLKNGATLTQSGRELANALHEFGAHLAHINPLYAVVTAFVGGKQTNFYINAKA